MEERLLTADITIEDILNYPFKTEKVDVWELGKIMEEFQMDTYHIDEERFDPSLFILKKIYNNPHDSDEQSYRKLLYFNGEPNCIYGYTGDRGDTFLEFFSKEVAKELYEYLMTLNNAAPYDRVSILDKNVKLGDRYTLLIQDMVDKDIYCHILSPKWSYVFGTNMKNLCFMDEDTQLIVPVEFVEWVGGKKQSWEEKPEEQKIVYKRNGVKFSAGYEKFLIKCETDETTTI